MRFRNLIFLAAALVFSMPVLADTYSYNLAAGNGINGATANYRIGHTTVTAIGYMNGSYTNLFSQNHGDNLSGLGLAAMPNAAISGNGFIQFDLNQLLLIHPGSVTFNLDSVNPGEIYNIWGSNTLGSKGILLSSGNSSTFDLSAPGSYRYITVSAQSGNVLVESITATGVPEPGTGSLAAIGLFAMIGALLFFRRAHLRDRIAF